LIDWSRSAEEIDRKVRAFNPWPVAQCRYDDKVMRIWQTQPLNEGCAAIPGEVLRCGKAGIDVATGDGVLRIIQLQMPGKRAVSAADFLNAHSMEDVVLE
jgi:methionyl-tRNA formyltransferase